MSATARNLYRNLTPVVLLVLAGLLVYYMRGTLGVMTVAVVFFFLLDPIVQFVQGRKLFGLAAVSHVFAVVIAMLFAVLVVAAVFVILIPPVVEQVNRISANFNNYVAEAQRHIENFLAHYRKIEAPVFVEQQIQNGLEKLGEVFVGLLQGTVKHSAGIFSHLVLILMVPFLTFYLLLEKEDFKRTIVGVLPKQRQAEIASIFSEIGESFRGYLIGQLFLSMIMWIAVWIGLSLLDVKAPLLLGLVAGLTKMIPVIGIFLGGVPAVLVAMGTSPTTAVWVAVLFTFIQLLENKIVLPLFLSRYVHLSPLAIMIALVVGEQLGGILGMFLCTPIASLIKIVYVHIRRRYD